MGQCGLLGKENNVWRLEKEQESISRIPKQELKDHPSEEGTKRKRRKAAHDGTEEVTNETEESKNDKDKDKPKRAKTKEANKTQEAVVEAKGPAQKKRQKANTGTVAGETQDDAGQSKPTKKRSRRAKEPTSVEQEFSHEGSVVPTTKGEIAKEILAFLKFADPLKEDEDAQEKIKGKLRSVTACRMNIYWKRPAVGLTSRAEKKDFMYFSNSRSNYPSMIRMAASLKAAELLAACKR